MLDHYFRPRDRALGGHGNSDIVSARFEGERFHGSNFLAFAKLFTRCEALIQILDRVAEFTAPPGGKESSEHWIPQPYFS